MIDTAAQAGPSARSADSRRGRGPPWPPSPGADGYPRARCSPRSPWTSPPGPSAMPSPAVSRSNGGSVSWSCPGPTPRSSRRSCRLPDGERRRLDRARRRAAGPALRRRLPVHPGPQGGPRLAGGHGTPRDHRRRPGPDRPLADRQLRPCDRRRAGGSPAASPTSGRSRPTTATPARSRACWPRWTPPGAIVLEVVDHGVVPLAAGAGQLPARAPRAAADRPASPGDHPAGGLQPHRRRQPPHLAAVDDAGRHDPARGTRPPRRRLGGGRRHDAGRSCAGPPSARWSSPTATPVPCTAGRTPSTSGEWGLGSDGQLAHAGVRLPGRDHLPRRRVRQRARQAVRPRARRLHPRGGLRDPLEAHRHDHRPGRGPALAATGGVLHRHRRATTSTASSGTSTSTAPSSTRSSSPGSCPPRGSRRAGRRRTGPSSLRGWPPRSTSTCSAPGSTRPSTVRSTRSTRSPSPARPRAGQPTGQRHRAPGGPGSGPSRPPVRDVDAASSRHWRIVNPRPDQRPRPAGGLQAGPRLDPHAAGPTRIEHRPPGRLRPAQPVGHPVPPRGAATGRGLPEPARRRGRPARVDGRRPVPGRTPGSWCGTPSG